MLEIVADPLCRPVITCLPWHGIQQIQRLGPDPFFVSCATLHSDADFPCHFPAGMPGRENSFPCQRTGKELIST
jgi:hypothetical protein